MSELTKEQIEAYQKQQTQSFLDEYNKLCEKYGLQLVPLPFIDNEGRTKASLNIGPK